MGRNETGDEPIDNTRAYEYCACLTRFLFLNRRWTAVADAIPLELLHAQSRQQGGGDNTVRLAMQLYQRRMMAVQVRYLLAYLPNLFLIMKLAAANRQGMDEEGGGRGGHMPIYLPC